MQFFGFEYIQRACPLLREDTGDCWPRINRWKKENRLNRKETKGSIQYNFPTAQSQIEMRSPGSINWLPYSGSTVEMHAYVQHAKYISLKRCVLMDPQYGGYITWVIDAADRSPVKFAYQMTLPRK